MIMWEKKGRKFITTEICAFESQKYKSHMKIIKYEVCCKSNLNL